MGKKKKKKTNHVLPPPRRLIPVSSDQRHLPTTKTYIVTTKLSIVTNAAEWRDEMNDRNDKRPQMPKNIYNKGGFEDKMTRKEAALILGVRESSSTKRIKEAHRKLLILNHPDTGGSTYVAGKINEAKELLLKGKRL